MSLLPIAVGDSFHVTTCPQRFHDTRVLAAELLQVHGLHDWKFAFNRRKRSMGMCFYAARTIELSVYFVERNSPEEIRDTILH